MIADNTEYFVEFKMDEGWVRTQRGSREDAISIEKQLHNAGIKARVVTITTEFDYLDRASK